MIVSYRANIIGTNHSVSAFLNATNSLHIPCVKLLLEDLSKENVHLLISQMLNTQDDQDLSDLVGIVMQKTLGNPFFVTQVWG